MCGKANGRAPSVAKMDASMNNTMREHFDRIEEFSRAREDAFEDAMKPYMDHAIEVATKLTIEKNARWTDFLKPPELTSAMATRLIQDQRLIESSNLAAKNGSPDIARIRLSPAAVFEMIALLAETPTDENGEPCGVPILTADEARELLEKSVDMTSEDVLREWSKTAIGSAVEEMKRALQTYAPTPADVVASIDPLELLRNTIRWTP